MSCSKKGPNTFKSRRGKTLTRRQADAASRMSGSHNPNSSKNRAKRLGGKSRGNR